MVSEKLTTAPAARTGAVKGRKELIQKYAAPINADVPDRVMRRHLSEFLDEALAALEPAVPEVMCVGCEGNPSLGNSPCAVCGKQAAEPATDVEPVAWSYEVANYIDNDGSYTGWVGPRLSFQKPNAPEGSIRNVTPLYTRPPENRLREADIDDILLPLEDINSDRGQCEWHDVAEAIDGTRRRLRAALEQGADDERA